MTEPTLAALQAEADAAGCDLSELRMPCCEPWLSQWCRLHTFHLQALRKLDAGDYVAGSNACKLADEKYMLYLADHRAHTASMVER